MFVFGHTGLTAAAARAADRDADLRLAALLAILPDLIDKPLLLLHVAFVHHNSRSFGHSVTGAAAVLVLLLLARVRKPWLMWACYLGHLALDRMWLSDNPVILLWPFLGPIPRPRFGTPLTIWMIVYNLAGELLGIAVILSLARGHRLFEEGRWRTFLRGGHLPE